MKPWLIILITYWVVAVAACYLFRYLQSRKLKKSAPFVKYAEDMLASEEPTGKRVAKHFSIVFLFPLVAPFVVPYLVFKKRKNKL